jgi:uncharacterized SAM-binding protein YcdF (DUF218 family)
VRFLVTRVLPLAVLVWAVAATAAYVVRHGQHPIRAQAVVVLEGSSERLPTGLQLVREGYAPLLVISKGDRKKLEAKLCAGRDWPAHVRVLCFTADPLSTRGEAEFVGRLAKRLHLDRIDVVTSKFHVLRAQMLIERCYHGELRMVGASQPYWKLPWYALTETAKLAYQLVFARSC